MLSADVLVVVPAGGTARRLGGGDKTALDVGGRTILDRVLDATAAWARVAYPRLREDQVNALAWKVLVPLSLVQVAITTVLVVA